MNTTLLYLLITIGVYLFLLFVIEPLIKKMGKKHTPLYNLEQPDVTFETWNGIGVSLWGHYRYDDVYETVVKYAFFCIIIPIMPVGCYRLKETGHNSYGGGYIQERSTKYSIYGTEKWLISEVILTYLYIILDIIATILVIYLLIQCYDWIHETYFIEKD